MAFIASCSYIVESLNYKEKVQRFLLKLSRIFQLLSFELPAFIENKCFMWNNFQYPLKKRSIITSIYKVYLVISASIFFFGQLGFHFLQRLTFHQPLNLPNHIFPLHFHKVEVFHRKVYVKC